MAATAWALIAVAAPAQAQTTPAQTASTNAAEKADGPIIVPTGGINLMITGQRRRPCGGTNDKGEIIVCGKDNGEDVRVPDDENRIEDGLPRAPQVSGLVDCTKKKCHGFGYAPPPVYYVDLKSIPEAPKDSDAAKVARGEMSDR